MNFTIVDEMCEDAHVLDISLVQVSRTTADSAQLSSAGQSWLCPRQGIHRLHEASLPRHTDKVASMTGRLSPPAPVP